MKTAREYLEFQQKDCKNASCGASRACRSCALDALGVALLDAEGELTDASADAAGLRAANGDLAGQLDRAIACETAQHKIAADACGEREALKSNLGAQAREVEELRHKYKFQRGQVQAAHKAFHELTLAIHENEDELDPAAQMRILAKERDEARKGERRQEEESCLLRQVADHMAIELIEARAQLAEARIFFDGQLGGCQQRAAGLSEKVSALTSHVARLVEAGLDVSGNYSCRVDPHPNDCTSALCRLRDAISDPLSTRCAEELRLMEDVIEQDRKACLDVGCAADEKTDCGCCLARAELDRHLAAQLEPKS